MDTRTLEELDAAVLREDLPARGLLVGDVGTVVMVYREGEAYEHPEGTRFVADDGQTLAVETLRAGQVEPLSGRRILHVRELAPA